MKKFLGRFLNALVRPFGLRMCTVATLTSISSDVRVKQKEALKELEDCFRKFIFPDLPSSERRIELMANLTGTNPSEALYVIEHLHKSIKCAGDICEFGVAGGTTSAVIANEILPTNKKLWLFDSFKGLPKPTKKDVLIDDVLNLGSMEKYQGVMSYSADDVRLRLKAAQFPEDRLSVVEGFIEETIKGKNLPEKVCFAYIDFDFYQPILEALNFLDNHLAVNGFIIVDDYGYFSAGAKTAVEEFLKEKGDKYKLTLPQEFAGHFCIIEKIK